MSRRAVDELCQIPGARSSITGLVSVIGLPTTKVLVSSGSVTQAGRTTVTGGR